MPNPLTAERAREIAHATLIHLEGRTDREYEYAAGDERPLAIALIDQVIETLEACAKEHCLYCAHHLPMDPDIGTDDYRHKSKDVGLLARCEAQYEQRELTRLRAEQLKLTKPPEIGKNHANTTE
jgi:hypothetical protein